MAPGFSLFPTWPAPSQDARTGLRLESRLRRAGPSSVKWVEDQRAALPALEGAQEAL